LRAVDPNPGATITFTTTDTRFVISGDRLSLAPGVSLDFDQSPTTTVAVTASNQFGAGYTETLTIQVEDAIPFAGRLDLVAAVTTRTATNAASGYLNNGQGPFGSVVTLGNGFGTLSVDLGDVNGDGHLDLASVYEVGSGVRVQLGTATGINGVATSYPGISGDAFQAVHLVDLNSDGLLDLAAMSPGQQPRIAVRLNSADAPGTFGERTDSFVLGNTSGVTFGDVNGDGNIDLINQAPNVVRIAFGDGTGSFDNGSISYDDRSTGAALGDLDGDGDLDIVTGGSTLLQVRLNDNGSFGSPFDSPDIQVSVTPRSIRDLALGDLNNDGRLDAVVCLFSSSGSELAVFIGDGDGGFGTPVGYRMGSTLDEVVLGDLDGDGNLDVLTSSATDDTFTVRLGGGDGTFGDLATIAAGPDRLGIILADLDGAAPLTDSGLPYLGPNVPYPEDFMV
jgi:hypothetical protein